MSERHDSNWADKAVEGIILDMNDRGGLSTSNIDKEIMAEIRESWAGIIRDCLRVAQAAEPEGMFEGQKIGIGRRSE